MSIKFLVLGRGGILGFWGGEVPILFYGREDFSETTKVSEYLRLGSGSSP